MAGHSKALKLLDQESQLKDIRRQLGDHLGCMDFRMESKLSLLVEFQEFFKRRGEVEYEYARSLERLCEKFERNTKQRNLRNEVRSTFNLWSTLLAETRKMSRERASLAEVMASEMVARLDVMAKDVHVLTKKCKDLCVEIQDQFLKELRDLSEQTKVYQHSCHNTSEAYVKVYKTKEKLDSIRGATARRKKAEDKCKERQKQYKVQKHLLLKNRNDYLLGISRCNALTTQYFSMDIMDIVEHMDFDYHDSFRRLVVAYRDSERETCEDIMSSGEVLVEQTKTLNFENDLHYFLSEYSGPFTSPNYFQFSPFEGDDVSTFKVNTEDVFRRWSKTMADLKEEIQTLQIQREEDIKTIQHMKQVNLKKYQVTSVDDALAVMEDNGDSLGLDGSRDKGNASLERGLSLSTRGGQAIMLSQKGKRDTLNFTLQISQRRILRADRLAVANAQLDILERAFDDQKVSVIPIMQCHLESTQLHPEIEEVFHRRDVKPLVPVDCPPVPVGLDSQGRAIPGEVPQLFGGEIVKYIMATGCEIPLIVESCVKAIEKNGMKMEGLFRVPGPAAVLDEFRNAFEEGLDPIANFPSNKLDVAAVASTLKAYFRELSIPLFPTDKYQEFITCARQEDSQSRLDALSSTIQSLPPQVIPVMRYLFRFLHRVTLHATDNKMGSPNLALVFGPTLTRAPDSLEPRQLHNDVPSVNILIQMCIDKHELIFGEGEDTPIASPSPDEVRDNLPLSTSPPAEPPTAPPTAPATHDSLLTSQHVSEIDEVCELPPPPCPPKPSVEVQLPPDDTPLPPRPPKPETMSPPPPPPELEAESAADEEKKAVMLADSGQSSLVVKDHRETSPMVASHHDPVDGGSPRDLSGLDLSSLDAKMQEIEDSLQEMDVSNSTVAPTPEEEEEEEEDTDSEDEDDAGMRIGARALYDYTARSDKELSFNRGDSLQVITKTPDSNWWDGFHSGKRGFIPVAYLEITELKTSPLPPPPIVTTAVAATVSSLSPTLAIPAPPERKSSIPFTEADHTSNTIEIPLQPSILEEAEAEEQEPTPMRKEAVGGESLEGVAVSALPPPLVVANEEELAPEIKSPSEVTSPKANFPVKSVRSLTKQFQEPEASQQPQPRVLVEPHTHRRMGSDHSKAVPDSKDPPPRSASDSNKVSMLSSNFLSKAAPPSGPPPPVRPKPGSFSHTPTSPAGASGEAGVFPLMQHGTSGVSPLQIAAHQSQHIAPKPPLGKKPPQAVSKSAKSKPVPSKLKKKNSLKEKDKGSKPAPNPKPAAGFVATPAEVQAELQARVKKRRQTEDKS